MERLEDTIAPELADGIVNIESVIQRAEELRVVPQVALKVQQLVTDPTSTIGEVVDALRLDPAMATNLLRLANSAYYGRGRKISTVQRAVQLLGMRGTRDLVFALMVAAGTAAPGDLLRARLWGHALRTGFVARQLAMGVPAVKEDEAFIAGLLHDLGVMLLYDVGPPGYDEVLRRAGTTLTGLDNLERHLYGFDHAEVAERCLRRWNFPPSLCLAAQMHHNVQATLLAGVVQLADEIDTWLSVGLALPDVVEQASRHRANKRLSRSEAQIADDIEGAIELTTFVRGGQHRVSG